MDTPSALNLTSTPELLHAATTRCWEDFQQAVGSSSIPNHPEFLSSLTKIWALSPYAANMSIKHPEWLISLFDSGEIDHALDNHALREELGHLLDDVHDIHKLESTLRIFRNRYMLRIIWRDLAGWSDLHNTMRELSALADNCINLAAKKLHAWQAAIDGEPAPYQDRPQQLTILALGKLGGRELNLSSDVDLIFCYPSRGMTQHPEQPVSHEEFFGRVGRNLIRVINQMTSDGYVFRVDMRLRPHGESGPLVLSFDAMENYYTTQGRDWERYALIKARVMSGEPIASRELMTMLRQFVYRQEIDFAALQSLRSLHESITEDIQKRNLHQNIKLGSGYIRSIEFIGQLFQLIHGGHLLALRDRRILKILTVLQEEAFLSHEQTHNLQAAYVFFRNVEHRLQSVSDLQTHQLPSDHQDEAKMRLAFGMGYTDWASFAEQLERHRRHVEALFHLLLDVPSAHTRAFQAEDEPLPLEEQMTAAWLGLECADEATEILARLGFDHAQDALVMLNQLSHSKAFESLTDIGRERLLRLMPWLLLYIGQVEYSTLTLQRMQGLLEAVMERTTYLVLLFENPEAFKLMVKLCSISPWISEQMARYPLLLGELLDQKRLSTPLNLESLDAQLSRRLSHTSIENPQQVAESLNYFKLVHVFRTAACDITGELPIMKVSDSLTDIATIVLRHAQTIARLQVIEAVGLPAGDPEGDQFAIIAYGKLGGIELGYSSDLDLVFVYQECETDHSSDSLTQNEFYTLMGRKLLQLLEARTPAGSLYEVDMRLRPSGDSGLLVTNMNTLQAYQQERAWTWEHQAIMRARMVSGSPILVARFERLRSEVLSRQRDLDALRSEVREMREKMRISAELKMGEFDLKQGVGGITDIEFIVQFGVLAWGHSHPAVFRYSDNIRMLESFAAEQLLSQTDVNLLSNAYRTYRAAVHERALQHEPAIVTDDQFMEDRRGVQRIWIELIG